MVPILLGADAVPDTSGAALGSDRAAGRKAGACAGGGYAAGDGDRRDGVSGGRMR